MRLHRPRTYFRMVKLKLHKPKTYYRLAKKGLLGWHTVWEPKVWNAVRQVQGDLFVDVGANQGIYVLGLRKHFKQIIAVEPHPEAMKILKNKVWKYPSIQPVECALCDIDGEKFLRLQGPPYATDPLYKTMGVMGSIPPSRCNGSADTIVDVFHYRPASKPDIDVTTSEENGIKVKAQRLDTIIHRPIDLVKIDVEGAEFLVLQGSEKLLSKHMIHHAMVELHDRELTWDLEDLFTKYGYQGRWVDPDHYYASVSDA